MEQPEKKIIERQTAYITNIATVISGSSGKQLSRVHFIGVVVGLSQAGTNEATIDDGTGKILARSFDNPIFFRELQLGDVIRIIGRVRTFNEQVYLIPEIMKKITNRKFILLHKLLLEKEIQVPKISLGIEEIGVENISQEIVEDAPVDADDTIPPSPFDTIITQIKKLDQGDGAPMEKILQEQGEESEKLIQHLLEMGEIFEIRPGRVKLLE